MMICHTPEQKKLYERGYPYLVTLVDGHIDDKKPEDSASKVFKDYFGKYHVAWPRLTAAAFVRGGKSSAPVTADEGRAIALAMLAEKSDGNWYEDVHKTFVLEALTSTDVVLEAITSALENLPKSRWKNEKGKDSDTAMFAYLTGLLLLRSRTAPAFTKRLEDVYAATVKAKIDEGEHTIRGGLDLALHGNAGAARALAKSHWQYWYWYLMVDDPAVHLARLADNWKSEWVPEARILYLAGEKLLPIYTTKKALRQGKRLPHILADFGMFAHDGIFELMVEMIGVKGAAEAPADYFRANAPYARPKLEKIARGSSANAVKAKAALEMIR